MKIYLHEADQSCIDVYLASPAGERLDVDTLSTPEQEAADAVFTAEWRFLGEMLSSLGRRIVAEREAEQGAGRPADSAAR